MVVSDTWQARRQLRDLPEPEPAAGKEAYRRELELALSCSERRRENYERYMRSCRRSPEVDYLPIKLDIENVSRCNFRCTMCVVSDWPKGKRGADMTLDDFKRLIDEQYGLVEIKLQGIGEPLMQGEVFFEMIRYARAQHIWVRTTTNASLLHLKNNYRQLAETDVNEIQISIDGADKVTFETIRRNSRFEQVIENCKLINGYCRERNVVRTKMWTVVQRGNAHQLEDLVRLAAETGFNNQVFSLELTNWGMDHWTERNAAVDVEDELNRTRLMALVDLGAALGVKVWFWNITEKYSTVSPQKICPWPFERAYISSDLRTVPCCTIGNPDAYELAVGQSFSQAWTSAEYKDFRQAHLRGEIPKVCRGCYYSEKAWEHDDKDSP
ncbi:MAG: radical SAM protein [Acidobacteria bacterium]|nr:radical SAM protein [Acidobacteriota bacterium]